MSGGDFSSGGFHENESCDSLIIKTHISSPKEEIISELSEGDILLVSLDESSGIPVIVLMHEGNIAGGIASPKISLLIQCIRNGSNYIGEVITINDGQVMVQISVNT